MKNIFASTIYAGGAHPVETSDIDDAISYIESEIIVKSETIPEASENLHKAVYQYIGETDSNFTHGFIYECKKSDDSTVVFTPSIIECSGEDFTTFLEDAGSGYAYDSVVAGTMEYAQNADLWIFTGKNSDDETVFTYQQYTQDFVDAGFTFTGTYEDGDTVTFERTVAYTYEWVRLDVQPNNADLTNYYTKTETDTLLNGKASTDLTNLSSTGQMIIDSQNGTISNCVLDIPQNLKCELSGTTYTLKAGSVRVKLGETYTTQTLVNDLTLTIDVSTDGRFVIIGSSNNEAQINIEKISSGTTTPLTKTTDYFWNITDKLMYRWVSADSMYKPFSTWYYPSCLIDVVSGVASFAKDSNGNDMIFNGAGFMGHHAFVYPNVTVFYPNGYSDVKHLNSVKITTNQLYITELSSVRNCLYVASYSSQVASIYRGADLNDKNLITSNNEYHYITTENYVYSKTSSGYVQRPLMFFVDFSYNGTAVTDFTIRQPVRTATVEMLPANFIGATSLAAGSLGLVPAPSAGDQDKFLKGDGSWGAVGGSGLQNTSTGNGSLTILGIPSTYDYTTNIGQNSGVVGDYSVSIGGGGINADAYSVAIGTGSAGLYSVAVGYGTNANTCSVALGGGAAGSYSIAIGYNSRAGWTQLNGSIAIGFEAEVTGKYSIALGYNAHSIGNCEFVVGGRNDPDPTSGNNVSYKMLDFITGKIPNDRIDGATGSFTSADGKTITVTNGVITSIV